MQTARLWRRASAGTQFQAGVSSAFLDDRLAIRGGNWVVASAMAIALERNKHYYGAGLTKQPLCIQQKTAKSVEEL